MTRTRSIPILCLVMAMIGLAGLDESGHAAAPASSRSAYLARPHAGQPLRKASPPVLALVRYIYRSLSVQPPAHPLRPAVLKMPLYDQYRLLTHHNQKASIGFPDGTVLHLNQDTDAVLASPHLTRVQQGEVAEYLAPGTSHQVAAATAVAGAIGTTFDVSSSGGRSVFVVLHGALQVSTGQGAVVVKSNHETVVEGNRAPTPPASVDAQAVFAWTDQIPSPDLGEDVALDANGGSIISFSSQRRNPRWHATHSIDGLLSLGWESATGKVVDQTITVGFTPSRLYRIFEIIIDPAASGGDPSSMDLKDFEIRVSSTGQADADFTTVFTGTCSRGNQLQVFKLLTPVLAKYVQLVARNNYGSGKRIAVAEFEAVANVAGLAYPSGMAIDRRGNIYVADTGNDRIQKLSSRGVPLANWGTKGLGPGQFRSPDGLTLDGKGNIYVADTHNNRIQKLSPRGRPLAQWGTFGSGPGQLSLPEDVAVDVHGNIYVTDSGNNRIQKLSPQGRPLAQWGTSGSGPRQLDRPIGIALDRRGNIYVSDYGHGRIQKLSSRGDPLAQWGTFGSGRGQLDRPEGLSLDGAGNIYVADTGNHRIVKLSPRGRPLVLGPGRKQVSYITPGRVTVDARGNVYASDFANSHILKLSPGLSLRQQFGVFGTIPQLLAWPMGIAVNAQGQVYLTDQLNGRVQKRSPTGQVLAAFGTRAFLHQHAETNLRPGQFIFPRGIAVDRRGAIYVADRGQIQELSDRGPIKRFKVTVQDWIAVDAAGDVYLFDKQNLIRKLSPGGTWLATLGSPGEFNRPEGLAVDSRGDIYAVDTGNHRVVKLDPAGGTLGVLGAAAGLNGPQGIAVDARGNLYVADTGNNRIVKLSPSGDLVASYGSKLLHRPLGVGLDAQGNIYVADIDDDRIVKLSPSGRVLAFWN